MSLPQRQGIRYACVIVAPNHVKIFDVVDDIHILEDIQPTLKPETYNKTCSHLFNWKTGREPEEKDLWFWP